MCELCELCELFVKNLLSKTECAILPDGALFMYEQQKSNKAHLRTLLTLNELPIAHRGGKFLFVIRELRINLRLFVYIKKK